jgi:hypothetical protein
MKFSLHSNLLLTTLLFIRVASSLKLRRKNNVLNEKLQEHDLVLVPPTKKNRRLG